MEDQLKIHTHHPSKFVDYYHKGLFSDCVLSSLQNSVKVHRLYLAKFSRYFAKYFQEHPIKHGETLKIDLTVNPNGILPDFITLLYDGQLSINLTNLPPLLKMASYYDVPSAVQVLKTFYMTAMSNETVLKLSRDFNELELDEHALQLAPFISQQFALDDDKMPFTRDDVYLSLSPVVFAKVLADEAMANFTDEQKVAFIDSFVEKHPLTSNEDGDQLASVINWTDPHAYLYLVRHNCDWMPAKIARPLMKTVLANRQYSVVNFEKELTSATQASVSKHNFSRWYPFAWCSAIRRAERHSSSPNIALLHEISTLGGACNFLNPHQYRLVQLFTSTESINNNFDARFALETDSYFMAYSSETGQMPMIGVDLGPWAMFQADAISINCQVVVDNRTKPSPDKVSIRASTDENSCHKIKDGFIVSLTDGKAENYPITVPGGHQVFSVTMEPHLLINVFRVKSFDFHGSFLPQ